MKVMAVIGMGYVGTPAAALFADTGEFEVIGIQRRSKRSGWKIDHINEGRNPIGGGEPGLDELIHRVVKEKGTFRATDDYSEVQKADVVLIDVQTPTDKYHVPRYQSLKEVCEIVGKYLKTGALVCIESTVAPGTTENIARPIIEESSKMTACRDFHLAFSYERVMVGRLLHNLQHMPRIIGGITPGCAERGAELYRRIVEAEVYKTDCLTAETAKGGGERLPGREHRLRQRDGPHMREPRANIHTVRRFVNSLPYDPSNPAKNPYRLMMTPGAGVGGYYLPKDSWLLKYGVDN